uniref:NAD-dependent epimerase/dehydratase domain-containing protein n=1 Tax=Fibrocapsa japonica TaxID=94617 RepID=A0A6U1M3G1_9STRA|mmetsp:Transcript_13398/g.19692  ORF Transcript_13398/g.19692 Transcript_13398/m.19692 type:complete len:366 (+) Transcript_13398:107-1204(+)|eukprot:CAMPEP_0113943524 /NCGR_PEP_ID=MMETSP1339-20121228/25597_1 /TAXON_ID=94617 /ORGANISM="Fibrocapsa japonica" /LENGTH=365 /DNA_ID=CAMNT_0000948423 /DNA_START=22 /DNA_END=1119 /DNA_ORIENTATION=- /assembly_acc=CAM_ASM_000762
MEPETKKSKTGEETQEKIKVCVGGGGGFIGSHLAIRLRKEGYHVICADWKENEFMKEEDFCDQFMLVDLRVLDNCLKATEGCKYVFNLAADMGGMGFIESNQSVLMYNNTMISFNMLEAARMNNAERYFYTSTACVYNEDNQMDPNNPGLKEADAWPAKPQDTYGLEKLYHEEMAKAYAKDFPIKTRIARLHNVYGPMGTWKGGREKAPAAFCRKAITSTKEFEMWGDGLQTRSFMFVDDCVEGILRITFSDCDEPLNLGTEEMLSMIDFAKIAMSFEDKDLPIKHIEGPQGVRGRNSDNTMIKERLGWAPSISIAEGLKKTYFWIKEQVEKDSEKGIDPSTYSSSVVVTQVTDSLEQLAGKKEG